MLAVVMVPAAPVGVPVLPCGVQAGAGVRIRVGIGRDGAGMRMGIGARPALQWG